jgi:hypothetical protein
MPRKKSKKHPMQMTDEEALKHLFHPEIVKAVKKFGTQRALNNSKLKRRPKSS